MRVDRTIDYADDLDMDVGKLAVNTIMENPYPMPHRLRSNLTWQPKPVDKVEPLLNADPTLGNIKSSIRPDSPVSLKKPRSSVVVNNDSVSSVAKQYNMHVKNKQRIKNLLALLGGQKPQKNSYIDVEEEASINLGESMSNLDTLSIAPSGKLAKLP